MKRILDFLFIKDATIRKEDFTNLFFSYDNISFVGYDEKRLFELKKYDSYQVLIEAEKKLVRDCAEYKAIVAFDDKRVFIRCITENDLFCDIMIYSCDSIELMKKYQRIFFCKGMELDDYLMSKKSLILTIKNNHAYIVKNGYSLLNLIGYDDTDFENMKQNYLDLAIVGNDFLDLLKENICFNDEYDFICKNDEVVRLNLSFEFYNGYYILNNFSRC